MTNEPKDILRFGEGRLIVSYGTWHGEPAVFIEEAPSAIPRGAIVDSELGWRKTELQPNVRVMIFPTGTEARLIASILCGDARLDVQSGQNFWTTYAQSDLTTARTRISELESFKDDWRVMRDECDTAKLGYEVLLNENRDYELVITSLNSRIAELEAANAEQLKTITELASQPHIVAMREHNEHEFGLYEQAIKERDAALARVKELEIALKDSRALLNDPHMFIGYNVSDRIDTLLQSAESKVL